MFMKQIDKDVNKLINLVDQLQHVSIVSKVYWLVKSKLFHWKYNKTPQPIADTELITQINHNIYLEMCYSFK